MSLTSSTRNEETEQKARRPEHEKQFLLIEPTVAIASERGCHCPMAGRATSRHEHVRAGELCLALPANTDDLLRLCLPCIDRLFEHLRPLFSSFGSLLVRSDLFAEALRLGMQVLDLVLQVPDGFLVLASL
jgi:hypothetical protein